jgi:riboflavin synthase
VREWISAICGLTDLTPTQLAREAQVAVTTLTRFVNKRPGAPENLGGTSFRKIREAASRLLRQMNTSGAVFEVDISNETASRTTLGAWQKGSRVNLERPLALGEELGGHLVTGHIDGVAKIIDREVDGNSVRFVLETPPNIAHFIAAKGSVALNGVALTVNEVDGRRFGVNIIPYTLTHTTWGDLKAGDLVNLEIDLLARYVERLASGRLAEPAP